MNIKLTFGTANPEEPDIIVCGVLDAEKTVCGNEIQEDKIANIVAAEFTREKVSCSICLHIIRECKRFKESELAK